LEVVQLAWAAYIAGDLDAVVEHFAPDVEVDQKHLTGWLEDDVYHGHAGFRRFVDEWFAPFERHENGVDEFIDVTPECVVTLSWQRAYGAGSHVPVEMRVANVFTLRNGKIARIEMWSDHEAARVEAFKR
jgi:ketosteroid isomerase-like protein